jgi:hypothetical protein
MSTTFSRNRLLSRLAPRSLETLAEGDRQITRIAGFFTDEVKAKQLFNRLRTEVGLPAAQVAMLRPRDGEAGRFDRLVEGWRQGSGQDRMLLPEHRGWGAAIGALIGGILFWGFSLMDPAATAAAVMAAFPVGAAWGALVGLLVVFLLERVPQAHRFDRNIRRHLRAGGFAVAVLHVPAHCQPEVLAMVRGGSRGWCAEAPRTRRFGRWRFWRY